MKTHRAVFAADGRKPARLEGSFIPVLAFAGTPSEGIEAEAAGLGDTDSVSLSTSVDLIVADWFEGSQSLLAEVVDPVGAGSTS